jgi:hypothetical protein
VRPDSAFPSPGSDLQQISFVHFIPEFPETILKGPIQSLWIYLLFHKPLVPKNCRHEIRQICP